MRERHRIRQPCKRRCAVEAKREREESVNRARDRKIERWTRMRVRENEITQPGKMMRREIWNDAIYYWSRPLVLFYCVSSDVSGRSKTLANVSNETRRKLDTRKREREKMRETLKKLEIERKYASARDKEKERRAEIFLEKLTRADQEDIVLCCNRRISLPLELFLKRERETFEEWSWILL